MFSLLCVDLLHYSAVFFFDYDLMVYFFNVFLTTNGIGNCTHDVLEPKWDAKRGVWSFLIAFENFHFFFRFFFWLSSHVFVLFPIWLQFALNFNEFHLAMS